MKKKIQLMTWMDLTFLFVLQEQTREAAEMIQQLRAHTAQSSVLNTQVSWLTIACDLSSRESERLFWRKTALHWGAHPMPSSPSLIHVIYL